MHVFVIEGPIVDFI